MEKSDVEKKDLISILFEVTNALAGQLDIGLLLVRIIDITMEILDSEVCSIFLRDQNDHNVIKCVAGSGFAKKIVDIAVYKKGEGFTGTVFETGKIINIKNSEQLREISKKGQWIGKYDGVQWESYGGISQYRNGIIMPLKIRGDILGVIKAENKLKAEYFSKTDQKNFEAIGSIISLVIENSIFHHQIENQLKAIAAKAAHRINNQIYNYSSFALDLKYAISKGEVNKEKLFKFLGDLNQTTDNLKRMVNEFREFGKPINLKKEIFDINNLINEEIWFARQGSLQIDFKAGKNLPKVEIDGARIAESIKELIKNSKTAILEFEKKGIINITTSLSENISGKSYKNFIKIVIKDNGPGIPENFPIFSPFNTSNPKRTGLGLATVKEIMDAHKGEIKYIHLKKGACFQILLPIEG